VWNSKRILLLGLGFFMFLSGYAVYAYFLGGIDGLPPLPGTMLRLERGDGTFVEPPPQSVPEVDRKLKIAFGEFSPEIGRAIKLEIRKKGLVLASDEAKIMENGQVRLTPFRVGIFSEDKGDGKFPEVNTIQSDVALLTFDQPIVNMTDIGSRKIVGAEIKGHIIIINNRRTPQKMDDIEVRVDNEPMYYDEKLSKIWSAGHVQLLDMQTQPETKILGKGLELYLTHDDAHAKAAAPNKPKGDAVSGVDEIVLLANVEMHLYPEESNSGFPSGKESRKQGAVGPGAGKMPAKQERSHVKICTAGRFHYDVPKDLAVFETPLTGAHELVEVTREILRDKAEKDIKGEDPDYLLCERLVMQFRRKSGTPAAGPRDGRSTGSNREIESALATARPGNEVVLVMNTEDLAANCDELIYRCPTPERGAQTVLIGKGRPMRAIKENHKIQARELSLTGADQKGNTGQQLEAQGPGQVDLFDCNKAAHLVHAFWQDMLVSTKARVGDRLLDLLTFTGDAVFLDEEHDQELHGQKLQVWLEPNEAPPPGAPPRPPESAENNPGQRLQKVEAFDRVRARSPEMNIKDCEHLRVHFQNGVMALPDNVAATGPAAPSAPHTAERPAAAATPPSAAGPTAAATKLPTPPSPQATAPKPDAPEQAPKKPIDLWGQHIVAYVTRLGPKNELRELQAEGNVHVHQDGSKPDDKGVDIKGDRLRLFREPGGDILDVYADGQELAQLQLGDLHLMGPKVRIDQQKNLAWVEGQGGMTMPSKATFDGGKPAKPDTMLNVTWTRTMVFNGKDAEFYGGVIAVQDTGTLKSEKLYVTLDKTVSFKEGQKGGQGAKAEQVVASGKVYVIDSKHDEKTGELVQYQRLQAREVITHNLDGGMIAPGPGVVHTIQRGGEDPLEKKPGQPNGKPAAAATGPRGQDKAKEDELFLTRVEFMDQMNSFEKQLGPGENNKRRTSKFYGDVRVLRLPSKDPDVEVDLGRMPPDSMYLRSEILTVVEGPLPNGTKNQELTAERQVYVQTPEFYARADKVIYDKSANTVTFYGTSGMATLYRRKAGVQGQQYDEFKGRTILYNRKTGEVHGDGVSGINVR
jgi:lipopolysaccharide export system protein LptA